MNYAALMALFASVSHSVGLPQGLLAAVCKVESNYNIKAINPMDGGSPSVGVCQMKKETAEFLGFRGTYKDLSKPAVNVKYAARYLKYQLNRYDGDTAKATAAYNAGSHIVDRKGRTVNHRYVAKVMGEWNQ